MRNRRYLLPRLVAWLLAFSAALPAGSAAQVPRTHVVLVVGIGGTAEFRERFHDAASQIYTALTTQLGIPAEDVVYLGEDPSVAPDMIADRATRANVLKVLGEIAQRAGPSDRVLVVLIGHGADSGQEPQFNVSGPDLVPSDFAPALLAFPTQQLALVHTGSASGGWVAPLAGPNRVVITATRSGREQNATEFARFFAEAIAGRGADMDHDNRVSLLEAFRYAQAEVARHYEEQNTLQSEHAVLDDNGDGEASLDPSREGPDGIFAAQFTLGALGGAPAPSAADDPVLAQLYAERDEIQSRIDGLRLVRSTLSEDEYLSRMEPLLVELALKNREIREREGGGN
ncbi:MAG TPA: hypothetical protein VFQ22_03115 [Longimicrobiales bacterium]|nr:hypothetical protein [Longimicrobiales bacterium]